MGTRPPAYVWEVAADGFDGKRVFRPRSSDEPTVVWQNRDETVELPVYEVVVTLEQ